jgi:hypothetical protein
MCDEFELCILTDGCPTAKGRCGELPVKRYCLPGHRAGVVAVINGLPTSAAKLGGPRRIAEQLGDFFRKVGRVVGGGPKTRHPEGEKKKKKKNILKKKKEQK